MSKLIDLTGLVFSKVTVIKRLPNHNRVTIWECICECGNKTKACSYDLQNKKNISCGCYRAKFIAKARTKHGLNNTTYSKILGGIKQRCYNKKCPKYKNYGGRGIKVCDEWIGEHGIVNFINDMGERLSPQHSIERDDVNGDYCKDNCYWATQYVQSRNKTSTVNIEYNGIVKCITDWATYLNMPRLTLRARIFKHGWSIEKAFETPIATRPLNMITIKNETKTVSQWSRDLNISRDMVVSRYNSQNMIL